MADRQFTIAVTSTPTMTVHELVDGVDQTRSPTLDQSLISATDASGSYFVAYATDGSLAYVNCWSRMGYAGWDVEYYAPPPGTNFLFAPTVCNGGIVGVAADRVWKLNGNSWVKLSEAAVASLSDCVGVAYGQTIKLAVLTAAGTVLHIHTGRGGESELDLGTY